MVTFPLSCDLNLQKHLLWVKVEKNYRIIRVNNDTWHSMLQNNFRWYKIIDTKCLVKIGLHFLKEKDVNLYLLKRQITKSQWKLRKWKYLCSSERIQEWEVSMAFGDCFPSYALFISPNLTRPCLSAFLWIQHGLHEPCNSWVSCTVHYQPAPRNTTIQHDQPQRLAEGNLGG